MTGLLAIALIALGALVFNLKRRLAEVERRADMLEALVERGGAHPVGAGTARQTVAERETPRAPWSFADRKKPATTPGITESAPRPEEPATRDVTDAAERRIDFESLIAGRLPIWIGGAALVLAGFFLVRYSIESGLLGPGVRVVLAALFAVALILASEAARRFPAIADDPRIGQVLAGAGVASAYGTLYMAAALYDLIGALTAFVLMLGVTVAALGLALRHGPPTAIMALLGGFIAPLIAGFQAAGVGPLLVYLGLFVAALFALAIRRGWAWLALAATASGFAWVNVLLFLLAPAELATVGLFVVLLAIGATMALPATAVTRPWLRLLPLAAGLVQLMLIAPVLDFSPLAWSFYLTLAVAALILAWRDERLVSAALVAAILILFLLAAALRQPDAGIAPGVAVIATLIFAGAGHVLAARHRLWPLIGVIGTAGPWLVALAARPMLLADPLWAALGIALAAASGAMAWRRRDRGDQRDPGLVLGSAFAAILAVVALAQIMPFGWMALPIALAMAGLAWWSARVPDRHVAALPTLAFAAAILFAAPALADWLVATAQALVGNALIHPYLPAPGDALRTLALPAVAAFALMAWRAESFGTHRRQVAAIATALALMALHVLAKQAFAIATPERFVAHGFLERALMTQALLAAAWWLRRTDRQFKLAVVLTALALFRIAWFDVIVFNPAFVAQSVGPIPGANIAVTHFALAAFWLWTMPPSRTLRLSAAAVTLLAGLVLVRQLTHGDLLTGPVGIGENWGYSAAPLLIAILWLWRGISSERADLRGLGIALLTAVTFKVFLIDAARLDGFLRVLSFLGLGLALIGIGALYGRFLRRPKAQG